MAPSGEDAGGNGEQKEKHDGVKEGLGKGVLKGWTGDGRSGEWGGLKEE